MKNIYYHYTLSRITRYTFSCIKKYFSCIELYLLSFIHESVFLLYEMMYNNNIYFSLYKRVYIRARNISVIHEIVYLIIRDDV